MLRSLKKLHALARISKYIIFLKKLKMVMRAFISSQSSYCPLVWMCNSRNENNKTNKLHGTILRFAWSDKQSTFDKLLVFIIETYKYMLHKCMKNILVLLLLLRIFSKEGKYHINSLLMLILHKIILNYILRLRNNNMFRAKTWCIWCTEIKLKRS